MHIETNMGATDRAIRVAAGVLLIVLNLLGIFSGWIAVAAWVVAAVMVLTAVAGYCPAYALFGFDTCGVRSAPRM